MASWFEFLTKAPKKQELPKKFNRAPRKTNRIIAFLLNDTKKKKRSVRFKDTYFPFRRRMKGVSRTAGRPG